MKMRTLVIAVAVALVALIAAAFALDCVRLEGQARGRVELADQELAKHEQRLVKILRGSPAISPEVERGIAAYEAAGTPRVRHAAFDDLVAAFRQTMAGKVDPTAPLDRKFMDDVAGALNRREVAEPAYDAEISAYRESMSGVRGTVASWFSPQADGADRAE